MNEEASNSTINSTQSLDETLHEYMKMQRVFFGSSRGSLSIPRNKKGKTVTDTSPLSASSKTAATEEGFISDHVREDSSDHIRQEQAPCRVEEDSIDKIYDLGAPIVSSRSKQKKRTKSRSVSFSEAIIAYFPMELGDNPSCRVHEYQCN